MDPNFRWENCYADIKAGAYPRVAEAFLREVVEPALSALDAQMDDWAKSDDPSVVFLQSQTEDLHRATAMAFCLSIQSMWERQLRGYLVECARGRKNDTLIKRAMRDDWAKLDQLFYELRGIRLSQFDDYETLNDLQMLGNTCRHGDGPSAVALWERRPDLWPDWTRPALPIPGLSSSMPRQPPPSDYMVIPRVIIKDFVRAIVSFWGDTECIYLQSLEGNNVHVERRLAELRAMRLVMTGA